MDHLLNGGFEKAVNRRLMELVRHISVEHTFRFVNCDIDGEEAA